MRSLKTPVNQESVNRRITLPFPLALSQEWDRDQPGTTDKDEKLWEQLHNLAIVIVVFAAAVAVADACQRCQRRAVVVVDVVLKQTFNYCRQ